jgi:hypothetical protein
MAMPVPGGGGLWQSLLSVTSQIGAQSTMMMPRASGIIVLAAGGAQIAQVIASNRKTSCTLSLDTDRIRIPAAGGPGAIAVRASPSCIWQAQSDTDWLTINSDGPMVGSGMFRYTAAPSTSGSRTATVTLAAISKMTIKGKSSITVTQAP